MIEKKREETPTKTTVSVKQVNAILSEYFELIDSYFGGIKHHLGPEDDSHIDISLLMPKYPLVSDLIIDTIDDLDEAVDKFWQKNLRPLADYVREKDALKCLYSGDTTPQILVDFTKRSALYVDTIILPDPIYNLAIFQKQICIDKKYYLQKLLRHIFNIWKLKDIILLDADPKPILILPINLGLVNEKSRKALLESADKNLAKYVSQITGKNLSSAQESLDFFEKENTIEGVFKKFSRTDLLPSDLASEASFREFMEKFSNTGQFIKFKKDESVGWDFGIYLRSQFIRVQEHKYFCERLIAEPVYDYEVPWYFFNYDVGGVGMDAAIANALQKDQFQWVNKMPIAALKVMRTENKLGYMRDVLRHGITDLKAKHDHDLVKVCEQVEANLKDAFAKQESEIKKLQDQANKIVGKEIPITSGGCLLGLIPYGVGTVVSFLTAGRDIKKALSERAALEKEIQEKKSGFLSLLLKSHE